ncbi:MAG: hypothetical protein KGL35_00035, partial [Bradyrhizobium sp.]|nr:hypothetical protein [Bradyrhizobium sp.]
MSAWFNIGEYLAKSTILGRLLDSGYRYVIHPKETAAGYTAAQLTFGFDPGDLRRYGADPTGVTASDAAMTKALTIMGPTGFNGGTIKLPGGTYLFNNAWNLNQLSGVTIEGAGNATAGAGAGTLCKYGGTGATHWIQLTSAIGCRIRCMALQPTLTTFTGAIVRCGNDGTHGDSALCSVEEVTFDATVDCYHLDLDKCIEFSARSCAFLSGATSVKGQASAGGSYSNVIEFQRCEWVQCQTAPINYLGQSWAFRNCTFEDLASGAPGAIAGASAVAPAVGLCVQDCWFGDATATVGTWIAGSLNAALIAGNYFAGNVGGTTAIALSQAAGVAIIGNTFTACLNAIDFAAGNCYGI